LAYGLATAYVGCGGGGAVWSGGGTTNGLSNGGTSSAAVGGSAGTSVLPAGRDAIAYGSGGGGGWGDGSGYVGGAGSVGCVIISYTSASYLASAGTRAQYNGKCYHGFFTSGTSSFTPYA
jgi:hypothetical protein